jgi:hypothetical protein
MLAVMIPFYGQAVATHEAVHAATMREKQREQQHQRLR